MAPKTIHASVFRVFTATDYRIEAKSRILARLARAEAGNFGDSAAVGAGVSEMRIHHGPGWRVYFTQVGRVVYLLLCGGDKSTQKQDIERAIAMAGRLKGEPQ